MIVFCAFEQMQTVIDYGKKYGFEKSYPLFFTKNYRDDPELKNNIQTIAQYQKAILQECLDRLKARAEALVQEINRCNADLEKCHPLDRGFLTDRRNEAIAKHTGTMEAREIVAGLKNNLERLTGWHD